MSWWNAQPGLPFPAEFAVPAPNDDNGGIAHDLRTVEMHGLRHFRWLQSIFSSTTELQQELLDRWHERLYPVLDEHGLAERDISAGAPAVTQPSDDPALREAVWRRGPPVAAAAPLSPSQQLPPPLVQRADLQVDLLGGVIARTAAPESLCGWEPSPCFPLARGGLRVLANLLPLHTAAHRDRGDTLLAALVREVVPEEGGPGASAGAAAAAAAATALGAAPVTGSAAVQDGSGGSAAEVRSRAQAASPEHPRRQQRQRVFIMAPRTGTSGGGGRDGRDAGEARVELRPLQGGAAPAAVAAVWGFVRAAVAAGGGPRPRSRPRSDAEDAGDSRAASVEAGAAAAAGAADADALAAALLEDLLCTNWAGLQEGMLVRSLPYRQLQLCGGSGSRGGGGDAVVDRPVSPLQRPEAGAAEAEVVPSLLSMYLSCTAAAAAGDQEGAGEQRDGLQREGRAGRRGDEGGAGTAAAAADEGQASGLLRRARAALAEALGWKSTGRRPRLEELLWPPPDVGASGLGGVVSSGAGAGSGGTPGGSVTAAAAAAESPAPASASGSVAGSPEAAKAAGGAAGTGEPRASPAERRPPPPPPPGFGVPKVQRPAPLSPRHRRPFRHPEDYVLWPAEPQPVARWVLVDGDTFGVVPPGAEAQAAATLGEEAAGGAAPAGAAAAAAGEAASAAEPRSGTQQPAKTERAGGAAGGGTEGNAGGGGEGGADAADPVFQLPESRLFPSPSAGARRGSSAPGSGDRTHSGDQTQTQMQTGLSGEVEDVDEAESAGPQSAGGSPVGPAGTANEGGCPVATPRQGDAAPGEAGQPAGPEAPQGDAASAAAARVDPEKAERARRAARRRAVLQQAAAAASASGKSTYPVSHRGEAGVSVASGPLLSTEGPSPRGGGGDDSRGAPAAAGPVALQLPGLKHLDPEAAASLEQAFAEAAAAATSARGRRSCHLRSVPVQGGAAAGGARHPATPQPAAAAVTTVMAAAGPAADSIRGRQQQATTAAAASEPEPAAELPLPGLQQLPPEAAVALEAAFREAAAATRRNYHLRTTQTAPGPPPPPPPQRPPAASGASAAAPAAAWVADPRRPIGSAPAPPPVPAAAWSPRPIRQPAPTLSSPRLAPAYVTYGPDGDAMLAGYHEQYIEQADRSYVAASELGPLPPRDRVGRCLEGFVGATGHVTYRSEEQELRVLQYRTFVRLMQQSRPVTGRGPSSGGGAGGAGEAVGGWGG